jgi:hypothetical protein
MADQTEPFDLEGAEDVELKPGGTYLLPLCVVRPELMLGDEVAIMLLSISEGSQLGIPLTHQSAKRLQELLAEALRRTKPDADPMQ